MSWTPIDEWRERQIEERREREIMPDHVHLLIKVDPQFGVHIEVKKYE